MQQVTEIDGRRARRERGRESVADAMLDLMIEHGSTPPVDTLSARAGVSASSIFRYFETLDDLQRYATTRFFERYAHKFEVPELGRGPLDERVERFVRSRVELHRTVAPIARFARSRALEKEHFASNLGDIRRRHLDRVRQHFATELDTLPRRRADDLSAAVATLTSFESWDQMVTDLGRTDADVIRTWAASLVTLLTA